MYRLKVKFPAASLAAITACVMLTVCCSGCLTGKVKITDKRTGNAVVLDEDGVQLYLETIDAGRFSVERVEEKEVKKEGNK